MIIETAFTTQTEKCDIFGLENIGFSSNLILEGFENRKLTVTYEAKRNVFKEENEIESQKWVCKSIKCIRMSETFLIKELERRGSYNIGCEFLAMKITHFSFQAKEFSNRQKLFLKDPSSDLFIIVEEKILPLHYSFLQNIEYLSNLELQRGKIHLLNLPIHVKIILFEEKHFRMLISYFYGKELQFLRDWSIYEILTSIRLLKIPLLESMLLKDIEENFEEYGFFLVLNIAFKFSINWLKNKCEEELIFMGFEQLYYNRYDLFQISPDIFVEVIRLHELLRVNGNIEGLKQRDLRILIQDYCKNKNTIINVEEILVPSNSLNQYKRINSKKSKEFTTESNNALKDFENNNDQGESCKVKPEISPRSESSTETRLKKDELEYLSSINNEMKTESSRLISEINIIKMNRKNSEEENIKSFEMFNEKLKNFEDECQRHDARCLQLQEKFKKISPRRSIEENLSSSTKS